VGAQSTLGYDANGNLTGTPDGNGGTLAYVYDAENRLVRATDTLGNVTTQVTLAYDPHGRLWQIVAPSATTRFTYDGDQLIWETDAAGSLLRAYAHGPGVDEPLLWYENVGGFTRHRLHADHHGSIVAAVDDAGNVTGLTGYDEWGIPNSGALTNVGRLGYTGQAWIPELGLWYYKARLYSATLGRFLQMDPVGYADQVNLYGYVDNDPVDHTDPTGLAPGFWGTIQESWEALKETPSRIVSDVQHLGRRFRDDPSGTASEVIDGLPPNPETGAASMLKGARAELAALAKAGREAQEASAAGRMRLPKLPTGKGTAPASQRDPTRYFSPEQKRAKLAEQGGRCANCRKPLDASEGISHHSSTRHSDGGRTVDSNHSVVCDPCHKKIHGKAE